MSPCCVRPKVLPAIQSSFFCYCLLFVALSWKGSHGCSQNKTLPSLFLSIWIYTCLDMCIIASSLVPYSCSRSGSICRWHIGRWCWVAIWSSRIQCNLFSISALSQSCFGDFISSIRRTQSWLTRIDCVACTYEWISNQQPTINNQQLTHSNQQSTINNQQSTINNQHAAISNR